jgi:hypothetical protein
MYSQRLLGVCGLVGLTSYPRRPVSEMPRLPVRAGRWVGVAASLKHGERTALTPAARTFLG